jgi:hypothetical protein
MKGAAFNWINLFLLNFIAYKLVNNKYTNIIKKETISYFYILKGFRKGI